MAPGFRTRPRPLAVATVVRLIEYSATDADRAAVAALEALYPRDCACACDRCVYGSLTALLAARFEPGRHGLMRGGLPRLNHTGPIGRPLPAERRK